MTYARLLRGLVIAVAIGLVSASIGCGGNGDGSDAPVVEPADQDTIVITKDCGTYLSIPQSTVSAEGVLCEEAQGLAQTQSETCEYPESGSTCDAIGFVCTRTSEEDAATFVVECTRDDARVVIEAPTIE